jgi:hypothetical protein
MASEIEKERKELLNTLNNQGRALERQNPDAAAKLTKGLRKPLEEINQRRLQK